MLGMVERIYSPAVVAKRLGISAAGLRRLAAGYERVHGELPRDERGRLWPEEAVVRLEEARIAVREGRATSVEAALRGAFVEPPPGQALTQEHDPQEALLRELRAIREAIETQSQRIAALEEENRALRNRLEAPEPVPEEEPLTPTDEGEDVTEDVPEPLAGPRPWWRRLFGG